MWSRELSFKKGVLENYIAFWEIRKHSILFTYGESLQHRRLIPDGESGDGAVATYLSWNTYYDNKKFSPKIVLVAFLMFPW